MTRKLLAIAALSTALFSSSALAQGEGFYIGVSAGANLVHDSDITRNGFDEEVDHDAGFVGAASLGYKYQNGFRNEIEFGYRKNDIDEINGSQIVQGNTEVYTAMVNLLFDLDITGTNVDTYIGGGAGGAFIRHDKVGAFNGTRLDDTDFAPAFQGIAGMSYALSDKADLSLSYQYLHVNNPSFKTENEFKVDTDYSSSNIMLGLKVNLSGGSQMPQRPQMPKPSDMVNSAFDPVMVNDDMMDVPMPAPQASADAMGAPVSRTYIVFFDFDKANVTSDARAILAQAAEDARAGNAVSIKVVGHADTSGDMAYNRKLSQSRANQVQSALTSMGLDPMMIETISRGETDPLVQTGDSVREAQNRRVEVTYIVNRPRG